MMRAAWNRASALGMALILLGVADLAAAGTEDGRGFYLGADLGVAAPRDLESTRTNNGITTNCDRWLDRDTLEDGTVVPLPLEDCSPRALPASPNHFELDSGFLAGVHLGYDLGSFRLEAEYFHRGHGGEKRSLVVPGDEKQQEFVERSEEIDDFRADHLFANLYYDFAGRESSRLTPYLGFGLGWMKVRMDYSARSLRTDDKLRLRELGRNSNAAGLLSAGDESLSDSLSGYQWIAGLDYAWSERFSVGLKLRYGDALDDFEDGGHAWKPLRGHASTLGPTAETGANLPILYDIEAEELRFWGISLSFKYRL